MPSIPTLPEEIIVEIVSRLPAESVGHCRCVSKYWRVLLSKRHFIRTHLELSRSVRRESLILHSSRLNALHYADLNDARQVLGKTTVTAKKLSFPGHYDSWIWVYGSCDGLLLVKDSDRKTFLLNPVTREIREVPHSPFFPNHRFPWYGLGYDSVNHDYKVVALSYHHADDNVEVDDHTSVLMFVDVWSSKTGSWTRVESPPRLYFLGSIDIGAFVSGCIHWLATRAADSNRLILAFDLAEMEFHEVSVPSSFDGDKLIDNDHEHAVLGGCLCIFNKTELWVMKKYGVMTSWTKSTIDAPPECRLRCFLDLEQSLMLKDEVYFIYNFKLGTLKEIAIAGFPEKIHLTMSFLESLISPHGCNETINDGKRVSIMERACTLLLHWLPRDIHCNVM